MKISYTLALAWMMVAARQATIRDEDIEKLRDYVLNRKYSAAQKEFAEFFENDKTNNVFNHEYFGFLKKVGDYEKILKFKKEFMLNADTIEQITRDANKLKFGSKKQVGELVTQSPFNLDVLYKAALYALENGNRTVFMKYFNMAQNVDENDTRTKLLKAHILALDKRYDDAILLFEEIGYKNEAADLKSLRSQFSNLENAPNDRQKARRYVSLYESMAQLMIMDRFNPSIYTSMVKTALEGIVDICLGTQLKGSAQYASKLVRMDQNNISWAVKFIRILVLDGNVMQAESEYNKIKKDIPQNVRTFLEGQIKTLRKKLEQEEQQRRHEEEMWRQQQKRRQTQMGKTNNAGKDFAGYYEVLNAKPEMNEKQLKKCWKKAARKAQNAKNKKATKGKGEDMMLKINRAKGVLCDKEKKAMYDAGYDPNDKSQSANQNYYQNFNFGGGFDDFDEIISQFFGGGGNFQQSSRRRIIRFG